MSSLTDPLGFRNLQTTEIVYKGETIKAKDLSNFKKEHPKMYALLSLLGLACTFGGKTIYLDSTTRRNVKEFLKGKVDPKAFNHTFVATVLKNFQRDAISMAMKGEEIVMPKSLFDAVLQKVCKADQTKREALESKFTEKDGNVRITHEDFLAALKENNITIRTTDRRYDGLVKELKSQLIGFKPAEKPSVVTMEKFSVTQERQKATMSKETTTKVTEHPGTIETESVEVRHRFVAAKDDAVELRNAMLVAFGEIEGDDRVMISPWDQLEDGDMQLLADIAADTDNKMGQLTIDHELILEVMDKGLEAAGYTTIAEFANGAQPNWPTGFRDAFLRYMTKAEEITKMINDAGEKHLPLQSSRLPRRTQSQIFKREELEAAGKPRSKEEGSAVSDRKGLKEINAQARDAVSNRAFKERAAKNSKIGLATQAYLKAKADAIEAKKALEAEVGKLIGPNGWFSKGRDPVASLSEKERKEWYSSLTKERRLELLDIGLKKAGWGSVKSVREAAMDKPELMPFLRAVTQYGDALDTQGKKYDVLLKAKK